MPIRRGSSSMKPSRRIASGPLCSSRITRLTPSPEPYTTTRRNTGRRVVVYGSGEGVNLVMRELHNGPEAIRLLGFIDDDPRRIGIRVHGFPVLGDFGTLADLVRQGGVDRVVISDSRLPAERLADLRSLCSRSGVALTRLLVGLEELVVATTDPTQSRSHLRKV